MPNKPNIIILGASSLITPWLVKQLTDVNLGGQCYSRKQINYEDADNFRWQKFDANCPADFNPQPKSIAITLLPLWLVPALLPQLSDCQQLIAFSTTSIFGKSTSSDPDEQKLVQKIRAAETEIIRMSTERKIPWTILRPTLIYDGFNDHNITAMAQFIRKWRILPVASPAKGLRQPVHAGDLATAVISTLGNTSSYNRSFNLGGGEIISYRKMVERVFHSLGLKPRIVPLPPNLIRLTYILLKLISAKGPSAAMFMRMNQDLSYDLTDAQQRLNYVPRPFQPDFHRGQTSPPG